MRVLAESINHFLFQRVSARPLAALRLVFGFYMVFYYIKSRWILQLYFTNNPYSAHIDRIASATSIVRSFTSLSSGSGRLSVSVA